MAHRLLTRTLCGALVAFLLAMAAPPMLAAETEPHYLIFSIMGPLGFGEGSDVEPPEVAPQSWWAEREREGVERIRKEFGAQHAKQNRYVGFSVALVPALNVTPDQLKREVVYALNLAEQNNMPVFFHVDDEHFLWRNKDIRTSPDMVEWSDFPAAGAKSGPVISRYWLHWGEPPSVLPASPPCFACAPFRALVSERLRELVAKPIVERLQRWKREGKDYLFAGIAAGNETMVPDYRRAYDGYKKNDGEPEGLDKSHNPPLKVRMSQQEMVPIGYHSLFALGYDQRSLEDAARKNGKSVDNFVHDLFYKIAHDYAEMQTKTLNTAGIPKERIYTHFTSTGRTLWHGGEEQHTAGGKPGSDNLPPPVQSAVNAYSRPGFTVVRDGVDLDVLSTQLRQAHAAEGGNAWAAVESYSCTGQPGPSMTKAQYEDYLGGLFAHGAKLVNVYGWNIPDGPYAISKSGVESAVKHWLQGAQFTTAWHRSETSDKINLLRTKLKKLEETAQESVRKGRDPREVQSIVASFEHELDPLVKIEKIDDALMLVDRTTARLQSMTH